MVNYINVVNKNKVSEMTAYFYFIIMNFMTYTIMLNLFTMVTLQQHEDFVSKDENPIEKYSEMIQHFKLSWNKFSIDTDKVSRMKSNNLNDFFLDLEGDLSKGYTKERNKVKKYISELNLSV